MSVNINIDSRGFIITPSGVSTEYQKSFNCLQTPTKITNEIMSSAYPIQVYKDWVKSNEYIELVDDYDIDQWDDKTDYYKIVGNHEYSFAQEHIDELTKFVDRETQLGFTIEVNAF